MRRVLLISTCFAVAALSACNQPAVNSTNTANATANANANMSVSPAAAEAEVRALMDAGAAALAKNDADAMDKIYGPNYMLVNLDGSVETREQRLNALRSGDVKYTAFAYDEINIRVNAEGNGAVAIARANIKGTMRGKPIDAYYRVTQVYAKTKEGWKQVSAQATAITAAASPSAAQGLPTPAPGGGLPTPSKPPTSGGLPTPASAAPSNSNR